MSKIKVLHLFDSYPGGNSQNWLYKIIINTPETEASLAAERFTKNNLYSNRFEYLINPLETFDIYKNSVPKKAKYLPKRILLAIIKRLLGNYKKYLDEYLDKIHFDVVHVHFAHVACDYMDVIKKHHLPLIVSFYGYDYEYLPFTKPSYKEKYNTLFEKADKFICEGSHGKSVLQKMGCPENKIEIVHLGVEVKKIPFIQKKKIKNSLRLLQVAGLFEKKGHIYTLRSFHKTLSSCPGMHLTIVGSGMDDIKKDILQYISENKLEDKITVIAEIDFNLLYDFMSDYDVFIHPSCYTSTKDCEGGAPIVLLDAEALGIPVISTVHCDIPDEVVHDKTGLLSPEKDIDSLSSSIRKFYEMDEAAFAVFSTAARKHVEENFDIQKNALKYYDIYSSAMKQ